MSLTESDLACSLQYSASKGIPGLLEWLIGLQEYSHDRKRGEGWDLTFGAGSSDLIYKVFCSRMSRPDVDVSIAETHLIRRVSQAVNALLGPGDVALIEAPVYAYVPMSGFVVAAS